MKAGRDLKRCCGILPKPKARSACQSHSDTCLSLPQPCAGDSRASLGDLFQPLLSSQTGMEPSAVMAEQRDTLHGVTPCHFMISACNICPLEQSPGLRTSQGCFSSPSCVNSLWLTFCHKIPWCLVPLPSCFKGFEKKKNAGRKRNMPVVDSWIAGMCSTYLGFFWPIIQQTKVMPFSQKDWLCSHYQLWQ